MRVLSNGKGVFILGILTGWVTDVNLISSGALLLSEQDAAAGIATAIAANCLFSLFLSQVHPDRLKGKFSVAAAGWMLPCLLLLMFVAVPIWTLSLRAFLWFGLACYAGFFLKWVNDEIALKHLDPGRAQSYFFHLAAARELGTILSFFVLRFLTHGFSPEKMAMLSVGLFILWMAFLLIQFAPRQNLEIHLAPGAKEDASISPGLMRKFGSFFLALALIVGLFGFSLEYLTLLVLKNNLGSFEQIKNMQADYYLVASLLTVALGPIAARCIQARRPSPILLLGVECVVLGGLVIFCGLHPAFWAFISIEIGNIVLKGVIGEPAHQMMLSAFTGYLRTRLNSLRNLFVYTLAGFPILLVLPWVRNLPYERQTTLGLGVLAAALAIGLLLLPWLRRSFIALLYAHFESSDEAVAVNAAQELSFLRPKDFTKRMESLLEYAPKILRKTVIIGLGYTRQSSALDTIIREFQTDREAIQLAVLDALTIFRNYRSLQVMVDIMNGQFASKSLQVRMNAGSVVGRIFGKKAIPFLLRGLDDPEPRIIANTLETLGSFKDSQLIPYFRLFIDHPVPRVRLNAVMALAAFRKTRSLYRQEMEKTLSEEDLRWVASAFFVIGKLKDRYFSPHVGRFLESSCAEHPQIQASLAWLLMRWGDPRGFRRFGELIATAKSEEKIDEAMHFFGQLSSVNRFDVIQYLNLNNPAVSGRISPLAKALRRSPMDFQRELDFLRLLKN